MNDCQAVLQQQQQRGRQVRLLKQSRDRRRDQERTTSPPSVEEKEKEAAERLAPGTRTRTRAPAAAAAAVLQSPSVVRLQLVSCCCSRCCMRVCQSGGARRSPLASGPAAPFFPLLLWSCTHSLTLTRLPASLFPASVDVVVSPPVLAACACGLCTTSSQPSTLASIAAITGRPSPVTWLSLT